MRDIRRARRVEWPTLGLIILCYVVWGGAVWALSTLSLWLAVPVAGVAAAFHSSLSHEVVHGHPFADRRLNEALIWPVLVLAVPYARFRDSHLAHHHDAILTDPYDDPESNYLDAADWERLPLLLRLIFRANATLAGRLIVGPILGQIMWMRSDWRAIRAGDRAALGGWLWHLPSLLAVLFVVWLSPMPLWAYLIVAWIALSLLKIRTFLEHQASDKPRGRTVIIEDRGPLALLFLNNNLHVVHHMHPRVPWYRLPALYRANPNRYLGCNGGYRYRSYAEVFARYFWRAKDPVVHPLWRR
ncbi:fatty acid desaturase [Flavimaricola marinus]|uniref:Fatty acid desaturase n=1 Tax=Flavimaricola marinus TaxID=1819565 RepID=A0A238LIR3_9RHOB|nr:fatty acid desaturase [Flavimaricola marinus]SMY08760.1 Fatty acid desaturase [Flavimaricola marinus]